MSTPNLLGDYLRARRAQVTPTDVGLRAGGVRRTPGLRREEVALLAGISADYYLRLEQGRDRNPSRQVLEALARVFALDATATAYLLTLGAGGSSRPPRARREQVPTGIRQLLGVIGLPAFVESRTFDVLAANALAAALTPGMRVGANRLRSIFLDPAEQACFPDWEQVVEGMVGAFRSSLGGTVDDPQIARLVGELSLGSDHFRMLWARHDVRPFMGGTVRIQHPEVGAMELRREKLSIGATDGQVLAVYHAEPGSSTAEALALLGSLVASEPSSDRAADPR